jgi:hypothetical protein
MNLRVRGQRGEDAIITVELRGSAAEVQTKTNAMTAGSTDGPMFYIQSLSARKGMFGTPSGVGSTGVEFDVCASFGAQYSVGRMWTYTWFKDPLSGKWAPLADAVLRHLEVGQSTLLQTRTFSVWFSLDLTLQMKVCYSNQTGFDYDVSACASGRAGFVVPVVGGVSMSFSACYGQYSEASIDITGSGLLSSIQFHKRTSTGEKAPLECARITDQDPTSGSGERTFSVETLGCCVEDVGVGWAGNFYVANVNVESRPAGKSTPSG